jgi:thiamine-phosphate pyrophosphorylase
MMRMAARLQQGARPHPGLPLLIALTDPARLPDPVMALSTLPRGSSLIWRSYEAAPTREALADMSRRARRRGILLLVAGEARQAAMVGTHFPERALLGGRRAKRSSGARALVTAAAHSERAVIRAAQAGVDAVLISPVFATGSHPGAQTLGLIRFAQLARLASRLGLAAYALGGVTNPMALRRLSGSGVHGVAGIGLVAQA